MPQSLANILLHLVFSTKDRVSRLDATICSELYPYLATVARNAGCEALRVGGSSDHIHLAIRFSRTISVASLMEELKNGNIEVVEEAIPIFFRLFLATGLQRLFDQSGTPGRAVVLY
jgi:REP element-mobilizing transposase RayT